LLLALPLELVITLLLRLLSSTAMYIFSWRTWRINICPRGLPVLVAARPKVAWPLFFYGWVGFVPRSASLSNGVISTLSNPGMGRPQIFRSGVALLISVSVPRPNLPALVRFLSLSPIKLCLAIIAANGSIELADAVILGRHIEQDPTGVGRWQLATSRHECRNERQ
jgi:hypothetical protein